MSLLPWRNNPSLNDELQTLIEKMEQLRSKVDDIQCQVQNEELQPRKKRKSEVTLWLKRVKKFEEDFDSIKEEVLTVVNRGHRSSRGLLDGMKVMSEQVDQLLKQGEFSQGVVLDDLKPGGIELVTEKLEGSTPLVVKDKVWSAFMKGESRVGIFGMGGVGKTTVAMHVNNEIFSGNNCFKHVFYLTISRGSSVHKLQEDISKALTLDLIDEEEKKRAAKLRSSLKNREKSLLILDDIWEDIPMEKVGVAVEGDGCKLLITTRKRDVCQKMNCSSIVEMKPLLQKEAWDLFVNHLGNYEQLSDEAKGTARSICKECSGLPLATITMARCMRGEFDEHVLREILRQLQNLSSNQEDMDGKVFSILKLSYERLNNKKIQECFLYCALYPEDYKIPVDDLVRRFIAVGILDVGVGKENVDKGHFNLKALESASLLETVTDEDGKKWVMMHDLIRDMALKIIGCEGMVKARKGLKEIPQKDEWTKDLVVVSLMDNDMVNIGDDFCPECPNLSVLILCNNPLQYISHSFFVHMAGLRILDLSFTDIEKLPTSISNLCNLNALLLHNCQYVEIIPSLAGLKKMRDLNLSSSGIKELPEGVEELMDLRYLDVTKTTVKSIPDEFLCRLCKLECFLCNDEMDILPNNLMSLKQLSSFEGRIADLDAFKQYVVLGCLDQLERYSINVGDRVGSSFSHPKFSNRPRRIIIRDRQLNTRRDAEFKVPPNVQILEFIGCSFGDECLLEALPFLCDATELESCCLAFCDGLKYIISNAGFKRGGSEVSTSLKGVGRLDPFQLYDFVGLYEGEAVPPHLSFGCLRELSIRSCPSVNNIWLQNDVLPNLESIEVSMCKKMNRLFAAAQETVVKLPCLKSISLCILKDITSICQNNVILPCLEELVVDGCPNLEKLFPCMQDVSAEHCDQMNEFFARRDETATEWPKLWSLRLKRLPELKSISRSVLFFSHIKTLEVCECPKLKKVGLLNQSMPSLRELSIMECEQLEEIFERADGVGDDPMQLPNLETIILSNLPELRSICRKAIVCNSLKKVSLWGEDKLQNCPISVNHDPPLPVLQAWFKPKHWWDSLYWNDRATKVAFDHHYKNNQMYKPTGWCFDH